MSSDFLSFHLKNSFREKVKDWPNPFEGNRLGELVYERTYSRVKENEQNEVWWETILRVVEGCYSIQKDHMKSINGNWDEEQAHLSAEEMYERMYYMKFLPPGRWTYGV